MVTSSLFFLYQNYFDFFELQCFVTTFPLFLDGSPLEDLISTSKYNMENIALVHSSWCWMWLICANHIISSCNLMFSHELLNLLQGQLSGQTYKLLHVNFILLCVIVQRVKVSVVILADLNLLPYQNATIQWRNFNKDICTNFNFI